MGWASVAEQRNDFSQGSIPKAILNLALPMTAAQLVNILYSVVDRVYLGRLPGTGHLALTGLGVTMPILSILIAFANLCLSLIHISIVGAGSKPAPNLAMIAACGGRQLTHSSADQIKDLEHHVTRVGPCIDTQTSRISHITQVFEKPGKAGV